MADFMSDAKSNFWSLHCECGATITITGENIVDIGKIIRCSNCDSQPDLKNLKEAVISLINFQSYIQEATNTGSKYPKWQKITPPGFDNTNLVFSCPLASKLALPTIKGD